MSTGQTYEVPAGTIANCRDATIRSAGIDRERVRTMTARQVSYSKNNPALRRRIKTADDSNGAQLNLVLTED